MGMTNKEKFKEVFGMNPDERFCPLNECTGCRYERKCEKLFIGEIRFWNNEYKGVLDNGNDD